MQRDPLVARQAGKVVHVVGRVTDEVFSFLGPAAQAVARTGREQVVVMVDDMGCRRNVANLHASAELVLAPRLLNPFRQWEAMLEACRTALAAAEPLHAIHLHGLWPALVGAQAVRGARLDVPVFFSPHGSRVLGALSSMGLVVRALLNTRRGAAIVNVPQETSVFEYWPESELVESPVDQAFFSVARNEARHPLIVTGGRSQSVRSAELVAQLAVLLSGHEDLRIGFNWIGAMDEVSRLRLNAAAVSVFDANSDAECAARMASGWIYLAPGATRGFPLFLAEAMAAGLPCVAFDCPQHRDVIHDGQTGYLCRDNREMIERIAALIDDPALRARIGEGARNTAKRRFTPAEFDAKLLAAYALER